jgi:hypothetical protein
MQKLRNFNVVSARCFGVDKKDLKLIGKLERVCSRGCESAEGMIRVFESNINGVLL